METKITMDNRVFAEDSVEDTARKIFYYFELNQSCSVVGWVYSAGRTHKKGDLVLENIKRLDEIENCTGDGKGNSRRKRVIPPNTIGGFVAHKIFRYSRVMVDNEPKINIWRIQ